MKEGRKEHSGTFRKEGRYIQEGTNEGRDQRGLQNDEGRKG
jgi:hypothetical protein